MKYLILSLKRTRGLVFLVWYAPDKHGYTIDLETAGRYDEADAKAWCDEHSELLPVPEHAALALKSMRVVNSTERHELIAALSNGGAA